MRLQQAIKILKDHGVSAANGTKHFQFTKESFRPYTVPAHNGTKSELRKVYARGICDHFGLERSLLGG